jgi:UDP-N-acetylglucosamine 4,6-dehydratase/5-epimerase
VDLATVVAPGSEIQYIGIRPSEKLHEVLLSGEEARRTKEFSSHFVIQSELALENTQGAEGVKVAENFVYSSDLNTQWLTKEEMQSILQVSVDPR